MAILAFGPVLSTFASFIASLGWAKALAMKAILYSLIVVVLPVVLWNLGVEWTSVLLNYALSFLPDSTNGSYIATFTGLAGWLIDTAKIPQAIEVVINGAVVRFIISSVLRN